MGSVRSPSDFGGGVHLDVVDDEGVSIEHLDLGVAFGVLEQLEKDLGALLRPASLGPRCVMVLGLEDTTTPASLKRRGRRNSP